jgi:hypothetical protein
MIKFYPGRNPYYPAIDEVKATYTIRPLVVIPIQD